MAPTVRIVDPEAEASASETAKGTPRFFNQSSNFEVNTYLTFSGANSVLLPRPLYQELKKSENLLLCNNCQRYISLFSNTPIIVPCGHTFCEMCVKTEDGLDCKKCEIYHENINHCIENKSYKNLLQMYLKQGQDCMLDIACQKYRSRINKRLQEICAHLPAWKEQRNTGKRFQMTLDFWSREIKVQETGAKRQPCPAFTIKKLQQISHVMCKADTVIKYQREKWDRVINEHIKGFSKGSSHLFSKTLNFPSVLKKMENIYLEHHLFHKKYYFKLSSAQEMVHIHAGICSSKVDENFEKENKIMMCTRSPFSFKMAFLEVSFYLDNNEKLTDILYLNLCEGSNFTQAKVHSLFLGRWESLKGVKMYCEDKNFVIPEPDPYHSLFGIPTPDHIPKTKYGSIYMRSDVILHRTPAYRFSILSRDKKIVLENKHHYIGDLESGVKFLERGFAMAREGIIEDSGLVVNSTRESSGLVVNSTRESNLHRGQPEPLRISVSC